MLHGADPTTYLAQDSLLDNGDDADQYPVEFLNTLEPSGLHPFRSLLKVGQPIMLIRDMNPKRGLCNRTRFIVRRTTRRYIEAEVVVGKFYGERVFIPRIRLTTADDGTPPVQFCRCHFPVKLAFAVTTNKPQGQTLHHVGVYLLQPAFNHGQFPIFNRAQYSLKVSLGY